jgi:hypothetical protein
MTSPEPRTLEQLKAERDAAIEVAYDASFGFQPATFDDYLVAHLAAYKAEAAYRKALKSQENSDA